MYRWCCNSVSGQGIPIPHCSTSSEEGLPVRFSSRVRHLIGMWMRVSGCLDLCDLHDVVLWRKMSKIVVNLYYTSWRWHFLCIVERWANRVLSAYCWRLMYCGSDWEWILQLFFVPFRFMVNFKDAIFYVVNVVMLQLQFACKIPHLQVT